MKILAQKENVKKAKLSHVKLDSKLPKGEAPEHTLKFDSNFECGNLHSAIKISPSEYHLFIHPDTNTGGHTQWFYFKVTEMMKDTEYTFKIMNFNKKHSAFQKGMKPCIFSKRNWNSTGRGWDTTETSNVDYCSNPFNRFISATIKKKHEEKFHSSVIGKAKKKSKSIQNSNAKKLYALAFNYKAKYSEDEVYIAFR